MHLQLLTIGYQGMVGNQANCLNIRGILTNVNFIKIIS